MIVYQTTALGKLNIFASSIRIALACSVHFNKYKTSTSKKETKRNYSANFNFRYICKHHENLFLCRGEKNMKRAPEKWNPNCCPFELVHSVCLCAELNVIWNCLVVVGLLRFLLVSLLFLSRYIHASTHRRAHSSAFACHCPSVKRHDMTSTSKTTKKNRANFSTAARLI